MDHLSVKFLHWNILSQKLTSGEDGASLFHNCEPELLDWKYRLELIRQHIKQADPDVIGLQEVDVMPYYRDIEEQM